MSRDFGGFKSRLQAFNNASSALVTSKGAEQVKAMQSADMVKFQGLMQKAGRIVGSRMKQMLLENASAAGLKGQIITFMSQAHIDAQPNKVMVYLPEGLKFKDGKGNVYAAIGGFTYGAVRQPITKRAGVDTYFDKISGKDRVYAKNRGALGDKAKRTLKAHVLGGAALSKRQGKVKKALSSGKVSVIPAKFPTFRTTPGQDGELQELWLQAMRDSLRDAGIEVA